MKLIVVATVILSMTQISIGSSQSNRLNTKLLYKRGALAIETQSLFKRTASLLDMMRVAALKRRGCRKKPRKVTSGQPSKTSSAKEKSPSQSSSQENNDSKDPSESSLPKSDTESTSKTGSRSAGSSKLKDDQSSAKGSGDDELDSDTPSGSSIPGKNGRSGTPSKIGKPGPKKDEDSESENSKDDEDSESEKSKNDEDSKSAKSKNGEDSKSAKSKDDEDSEPVEPKDDEDSEPVEPKKPERPKPAEPKKPERPEPAEPRNEKSGFGPVKPPSRKTSRPSPNPPNNPNPPNPPKKLSDETRARSVFGQNCLIHHNRYRRLVGSVPLAWSASLEAMAYEWARHLSLTGSFEHSRQPSYGENLYQSNSANDETCNQPTYSWFEEWRLYQGQPIGQGNPNLYGHYTQMVWPSSTQLGCAYGERNMGQTRSRNIVCKYLPAGNVRGKTAPTYQDSSYKPPPFNPSVPIANANAPIFDSSGRGFKPKITDYMPGGRLWGPTDILKRPRPQQQQQRQQRVQSVVSEISSRWQQQPQQQLQQPQQRQ
ncbi:hypothetical protein QVD99_002565 [Batrachochytrium dendrobatidis]|nr:hypothetical protein O5D80_006793 [Batrachochytrium dendrobatidis]KAK5670795.1 hypothetical protein QVD99_002565 [Batrachochytrium dendrobatidis]